MAAADDVATEETADEAETTLGHRAAGMLWSWCANARAFAAAIDTMLPRSFHESWCAAVASELRSGKAAVESAPVGALVVRPVVDAPVVGMLVKPVGALGVDMHVRKDVSAAASTALSCPLTKVVCSPTTWCTFEFCRRTKPPVLRWPQGK